MVKPAEIRVGGNWVHYSHLKNENVDMYGQGVLNFSSSISPEPSSVSINEDSFRGQGGALSMPSDFSQGDLREEAKKIKQSLKEDAVGMDDIPENQDLPQNLRASMDSQGGSGMESDSIGSLFGEISASPGGMGAAGGGDGSRGGSGGGNKKPPGGSGGRGAEEGDDKPEENQEDGTKKEGASSEKQAGQPAETIKRKRGRPRKKIDGEDTDTSASSSTLVGMQAGKAAEGKQPAKRAPRKRAAVQKATADEEQPEVIVPRSRNMAEAQDVKAAEDKKPSKRAPRKKAAPSEADPEDAVEVVVSRNKDVTGTQDVNAAKDKKPAKRAPRKRAAVKDADAESGKEGSEVDQGRSDSAASQQEMLTEYEPVMTGGWEEGADVPFSHLASTLDTISETRKRLEIQAILTNSLRSVLTLSPKDLVPFVYITLSRVAPSYEGLELGVGDSVLLQAVARASGTDVKQLKERYKKVGDLGLVAAEKRGGQLTLFPVAKLTLRSVFSAMKQVAATSGKDTVKKRVDVISGLLVAASASETKWIVRALQGKLRVGLQEPTVIVALATALVMNPPKATGQVPPPPEERKVMCTAAAEALKAALAQLPCYDKVLEVLLEHPYTELARLCPLTPGVPVKPMLAHPMRGIEDVLEKFANRSTTSEFKYDGERAQVHIVSDGSVKIFSRNSEETTGKFPDLVAGMNEMRQLSAGVKEAVIDCEVVAYDEESEKILPFQTLSTRARKNVVSADIKVQVRIFAFDLLFLNGESLLKETFAERRRLLQSSLKETDKFGFVTFQDSNDPELIQEFLQEAVQHGCEGLMVKGLDTEAAQYAPDKRSREWLKVKKDYIQGMADSFDLVLVAAWKGRGKRTGLYGAFLLACFNPDTGQYESVCRLGTGFSDVQLSNFSRTLSPLALPSPPPEIVPPAGAESEQPDVWFDPVQVWEVEASDLSISPRHTAGLGVEHPTRGIALRFPRFIRVREDKDGQSATQTEQVLAMYRQQTNLAPASRPLKDNSDVDVESE